VSAFEPTYYHCVRKVRRDGAPEIWCALMPLTAESSRYFGNVIDFRCPAILPTAVKRAADQKMISASAYMNLSRTLICRCPEALADAIERAAASELLSKSWIRSACGDGCASAGRLSEQSKEEDGRADDPRR
jgi:hypothetical protein